MDYEYQEIINELEFSMGRYETKLINDLTTVMQTEGYTKFYFDGLNYIFEDSFNTKYPLPIELYTSINTYYNILNRNNIEINL